MADNNFKTVGASDNPDHEKVEAQRERDRAEQRKQQATAAELAGRSASAEEKASEAQQGRGPAGQNTGPSDTQSVDPHRPRGYPSPGNPSGGAPQSEGMGTSPPQRAKPPSDRPEDEVAGSAQRAYEANPTPENKKKMEEEKAAREKAKQERQAATADLRNAEGKIADQQSKPAPEVDRDRRDRK